MFKRYFDLKKTRNVFDNILQLALIFNIKIQRSLQIGFDALAIFIAFVGAIFLRFENIRLLEDREFFISYLLILLPTLLIFAKMGLYRAFLRYVSTEIAVLVGLGSFLSAVFMILNKFWLAPIMPLTVPIIYSALLFIIVTGSRFTLRAMIRTNSLKKLKNISIYGAGAAGAQLLQSLASSSDYQVQMIIDDNPSIQGQRLYGLRIMSFEEASKNFKSFGVEIMLLAMPSASFSARQHIISKVNDYALQVKTIPGITSIIDGSAQITEFKDIAIEDLLGRQSIDTNLKPLNKNILSKTVLVTGAGGSIGSELCRQIIELKPKVLILFDISELAIYTIVSELEKYSERYSFTLIPLVGSVQDKSLVSTMLKNYNVDTIYHAAAYKHVPLMELNEIQSIKNNTIGTLVIAKEAVIAKVNNFTFISTDKAVNPSNIMGASKRLAERVCHTMNIEQSVTRFSVVRFGNVLGSSGSVVPLFQKQIAAGGPVTLTHPDVIRYFMTVGEAVQLVIKASTLTKGGDVYVLDMGVPVKIKDLAFKMIYLSGLRPYMESDSFNNEGDIAVRITGLRSGEKMYEELSYAKDLIGTSHPRIMTMNEKIMKPDEMLILIRQLETVIKMKDFEGLLSILIEFANYNPNKATMAKRKNSFQMGIKKLENNKVVSMLANKKKKKNKYYIETFKGN